MQGFNIVFRMSCWVGIYMCSLLSKHNVIFHTYGFNKIHLEQIDFYPKMIKTYKQNRNRTERKTLTKQMFIQENKRAKNDIGFFICHNILDGILLGANVQPLIFDICDNTEWHREKFYQHSAGGFE